MAEKVKNIYLKDTKDAARVPGMIHFPLQLYLKVTKNGTGISLSTCGMKSIDVKGRHFRLFPADVSYPADATLAEFRINTPDNE